MFRFFPVKQGAYRFMTTGVNQDLYINDFGSVVLKKSKMEEVKPVAMLPQELINSQHFPTALPHPLHTNTKWISKGPDCRRPRASFLLRCCDNNTQRPCVSSGPTFKEPTTHQKGSECLEGKEMGTENLCGFRRPWVIGKNSLNSELSFVV